MKRRKFISSSLTAAAGVMLLPVISAGKTSEFRQCSLAYLRNAEEYIRDGSIGKLEAIKIGLKLKSLKLLNIKYPGTEVNATRFKCPVKFEGTILHDDFIARADLGNGIILLAGNNYPDGIRFEGTNGWIFVAEDIRNTDASNRKLLNAIVSDSKSNLPLNVLSEKEPDLVAEVRLIPCNTGLLIDIAMKTGRCLFWDPVNGRFIDDFEANNLL